MIKITRSSISKSWIRTSTHRKSWNSWPLNNADIKRGIKRTKYFNLVIIFFDGQKHTVPAWLDKYFRALFYREVEKRFSDIKRCRKNTKGSSYPKKAVRTLENGDRIVLTNHKVTIVNWSSKNIKGFILHTEVVDQKQQRVDKLLGNVSAR